MMSPIGTLRSADRLGSGNVATEDVVYMLDGMGVQTGIDLEKLVAAGQQISRELGREPASRVGRLERRWPALAS
jgi:isopropylmalate/homocitrate/citramalate synthase